MLFVCKLLLIDLFPSLLVYVAFIATSSSYQYDSKNKRKITFRGDHSFEVFAIRGNFSPIITYLLFNRFWSKERHLWPFEQRVWLGWPNCSLRCYWYCCYFTIVCCIPWQLAHLGLIESQSDEVSCNFSITKMMNIGLHLNLNITSPSTVIHYCMQLYYGYQPTQVNDFYYQLLINYCYLQF